jgi:hypothetical protein
MSAIVDDEGQRGEIGRCGASRASRTVAAHLVNKFELPGFRTVAVHLVNKFKLPCIVH